MLEYTRNPSKKKKKSIRIELAAFESNRSQEHISQWNAFYRIEFACSTSAVIQQDCHTSEGLYILDWDQYPRQQRILPDDQREQKMFRKIVVCCRLATQIKWQPLTFSTSLTIYDCSSSQALSCLKRFMQTLKYKEMPIKMSYNPSNTEAATKNWLQGEVCVFCHS